MANNPRSYLDPNHTPYHSFIPQQQQQQPMYPSSMFGSMGMGGQRGVYEMENPNAAFGERHPKSRPFLPPQNFPQSSPSKLLPVRLKYDIHSWSSHSASYHPRHIMENRPTDQSSRWSSDTNNQLQFILVKLDRMSVVHTITFGKYHKVHVCNLKEFKVYGGLSPDNMHELLHSGLRNDTEPETFTLKYKTKDVVFPCLYFKIVPLLAWGANFNFSVWYVEFRGVCEPEIVDRVYWNYSQYREREVIRLCMKHLRQRNLLETFDCMQQRTGIQLEDSLLTQLHKQLVMEGGFATAEKLIEEAAERNVFAEYISECPYQPAWKKVVTEPDESPTMRGGHHMEIDVETGRIYMFGGWDGSKNLSDFWMFDQDTRKWTCLSPDTQRDGGPGPRSCHKMAFEPTTKTIFTLGRYVDAENASQSNLESDFYKYEVVTNRWTRLSANTVTEGGPELIFDHQMCIDVETQTIYVFGGKAIQSQSLSGLYTYDIPTNTWRLVRSDGASTPNGSGTAGSNSNANSGTNSSDNQLKSRVGHSMLFNPVSRELYIFAGQAQNKDHLSDFYIYEIDTDIVHVCSRDFTKQGGPEAGFTQRATIDVDLGEVYMLSGLMRAKTAVHETVRNSFWVYQLRKDKWTKVYENDHRGQEYWAKVADKEPCPRFAHQMVYDSKRKVQFMFGGNSGGENNNQRLDDFWELWLLRPTAADTLRRAKFMIRRQKFREMCMGGPPGRPEVDNNGVPIGNRIRTPDTAQALSYLQTDVHAVVNHVDEGESKEFRELTSYLFNGGFPLATPTGSPTGYMSANSVAYGNAHMDMEIEQKARGVGSDLVSGIPSPASPGVIEGMGGLTGYGGMTSTVWGIPRAAVVEGDIYRLRAELYEQLLSFFPEWMKQPTGNLADMIPFS
ncbi:Muskelin N-terminus-domain-containing protein [Cladochytrium replicatum]|nr:Muskelin N-terminus-domain-containing protein [Cladochytrium replicatum]